MNPIMSSDDASEESEILSALNASFESFVHKALKHEQVECIHRIACHGKDVLAVLPTGLGKSAIRERSISVNFKCCFVWAVQQTPHQKPPQNYFFLLAYKVERYLHQVLLLKLAHYERNKRTCFTK